VGVGRAGARGMPRRGKVKVGSDEEGWVGVDYQGAAAVVWGCRSAGRDAEQAADERPPECIENNSDFRRSPGTTSDGAAARSTPEGGENPSPLLSSVKGEAGEEGGDGAA
jgi:hypothetical protein